LAPFDNDKFLARCRTHIFCTVEDANTTDVARRAATLINEFSDAAKQRVAARQKRVVSVRGKVSSNSVVSSLEVVQLALTGRR
jgi:hypothetical protein